MWARESEPTVRPRLGLAIFAGSLSWPGLCSGNACQHTDFSEGHSGLVGVELGQKEETARQGYWQMPNSN
jgi:hypothetical protein